uniref:Reverse transcriptase domain-containing protein n=1 Tax=Tanacetum cinerariifolium TaxID=118510 RepID=A0A6L2KIK4_TANCI|nr:reverse transcriptase domain-containing protein [Tanacetum cinerariifolium]
MSMAGKSCTNLYLKSITQEPHRTWCHRSWTGPVIRSCTKSSNEVMSCTIKGKPLDLSWGRTPRLDSSVRYAVDVTRLKFWYPLYPCVLRDLRDAPLPLLDSFACPALFSWRTAKNVTRDPAPVASDLNAHDYATLVAHPSPFRKFPKEFLCLVGLDRHYTLDEETYPWFLHKNGEDMDLFAFIHTPDPNKVKIVEQDELETSIDKLFDEGGSGSQASRRQRKMKIVVAEASGSSHPPKKLREDDPFMHGIINPELIKRLHEKITKTMDEMMRVTTSFLRGEVPALNHERKKSFSPWKQQEEILFPPLNEKEGTKGPMIVEAETGGHCIHRMYVDGGSTSEILYEHCFNRIHPEIKNQMVSATTPLIGFGGEIIWPIGKIQLLVRIGDEEHFALAWMNFVVIRSPSPYNRIIGRPRASKAIRLRAEASNFMTVEKSIRDEVNASNRRSIILEKQRTTLDVKVADLKASTVSKERELTDLHAQLTFVKSHNDSLADQVHELAVASSVLQEKLSSYENLTKRLEEFQDARLKVVNDKFDKLYADFVEMALHLEERFYPYLLTTISGHQWLLIHGMQLAISKCLNSSEYLSALGTAIGKAIEKGMQDGLSAEITHGMEEETLAERLGLSELQLHVDQLMVLIYHSPDKTVVGATSLSFVLDASNVRVWKIRKNITGTSDIVPATAVATTALSTTLASANTVASISVDDYVVASTDDQAGADGNADSFLNVDDAEMNIL